MLGNEKGEEFYEVELTLDELAKYLFDDLNLPDLEKKADASVLAEKIKRKGFRTKGIRARLSKKETLKNKIKRRNQAIKNKTFDPESDERFTFHQDDLKYKHIDIKYKPVTNAVIFFIMDVSGSMGKEKKFLARSFFFLLYQFIRYRYEKIDIVFIAHTTDAKEVNEDDFFQRGSSGGTFISSGLEKSLEVINERYNPSSWNLYAFHGSDGENWSEDNEKVYGKEMAEVFEPLVTDNFKVLRLGKKQDVWPQFSKLFGGKYDLK